EVIDKALSKLSEDSKPEWGKMTPEQMIEHLELTYRIASGEFQNFEVATPEKYLEDTQATLRNYEPMPKNYNFPLYKDGQMPDLKHDDLETAKEKFKEARKEYREFFKKHPKAKAKNAVFGELSK